MVPSIGRTTARRASHEQFGRHLTVGGELLDQSSQQLGQNDARIAACAHERTVRDGVGDLGHRSVGLDLIEFGEHRFNSERHIRARVPVGHGIDVQSIYDLFMGA